MLLTKIDELLRGDHSHLSTDDECYALREYTPREGFSYSDSNSLILNLKKSPDKRGKPEWRYKEKAIEQAGNELRVATNKKWLATATIVPIPPSKARGHELHDDRILQVAHRMCEGTTAEVRELLYQATDTEAFHSLQDKTRNVDELKKVLKIDESCMSPAPTNIGLLDDVLTTGAHFVAAQAILRARFPTARILGIFIARRVIVSDDDQDPLNDDPF